MRLEGTLDAFGLPDILQLLSFTGKTGALRLSASPAAGVVYVRDGAICAASSDLTRQVLARRIVGAGLVDDDALTHAVRAAAAGSGLVAALLAAGALEVEAVLPLAAEQVVDAVGELLRWDRGEFSFLVDRADPDRLPLTLAVDEVVAEGQRRLAVWAELTAVIPTPDVVLGLAVAPAEDPHCTREEWGLLALVDGARTVRDIVALLGRGEFAVVRSLAALVTRGLLVVPGRTTGAGGLAELHRRQAMLAELETGGSREASAAPVAHAPTPVAEPDTSPMPVVPAPLPGPTVSPASPVSAVSPVSPVSRVSPVSTDGANALAAEVRIVPDPQAESAPPRPALSIAAEPQAAPVTRSLLFRVPGLPQRD